MPDVPVDTPARILIGLDPGTNVGLAQICAETGAVVEVTSAPPLAAVRRLEALAVEGVLAGAYVEDARALPIYARHGRAGRGERDRIARSVGQVDGLTGLLVDLLVSLGVPTRTVEPVRSKKWDAETCARDALRICYGRGVPNPLLAAR